MDPKPHQERPIEFILEKAYGGLAGIERMLRLGLDAYQGAEGSEERNRATEKQVDVAYWWIQKELVEATREKDMVLVAALAIVRERIEKVDELSRPTVPVSRRYFDWEMQRMSSRPRSPKSKSKSYGSGKIAAGGGFMAHNDNDDPRRAFDQWKNRKPKAE